MRHVILGFTLVVVVGGTAFAQEPARLNVVQACKVKPGETGQLVAAFREFVEYAVENTPDLIGVDGTAAAGRPGGGSVYGSFIQLYNSGQDFATVYEMPTAGAYEEFTAARRELIRSNARWGELWRAWRAHFVPQSCVTTFHRRITP